jgi:hypothetical protein
MSQTVKIGDATIDLNVDAKLAASVLRVLVGSTPLDLGVDSLPVPERPLVTALAIRAIRWYRATLARRIGHRCVFDPSCSRYAEMALRQEPILRALTVSALRLARC